MKQSIEVFKWNDIWVMRTDDVKVIELFGTDTLPTPYGQSTPWETVLSALRQRNPESDVTLIETPEEEGNEKLS